MKQITIRKPTKFCILTRQRSGSTWLRTLLGSHPEIKSLGEIFLDHKPNRRWQKDLIMPFYQFQESMSLKRPWVVFEYLDTLNDYPEEYKAVGYKLMFNTLVKRPEIFLKMIANQFKIIHLIRNNYLDVIISRENAWGKSENRVQHTNIDVKLEPIYLNTTTLLQEIRQLEARIQKHKSFLHVMPIPTLQIEYEELCTHTDTVLSSIVNFLGLSNSEITYKSNLKKINKGKYSEKIANYKEVKNLLSNTKYENLLMN